MQRLGQAFYSELGAVVQRSKRKRHLASDGGNIDDGSAALLAKVRQQRLRSGQDTDHVDIELASNLFDRCSLKRPIGAITSVLSSCSRSGERIVAMTFQPADWKRLAAALPIPLDAPVIRIVLVIALNLLRAL
jgi:hypothetical protein